MAITQFQSQDRLFLLGLRLLVVTFNCIYVSIEYNNLNLVSLFCQTTEQILLILLSTYICRSILLNITNNIIMSTEQRAQPLRLGSVAPNFQAQTTSGDIDFHEFIGDNWVVLFSHPEDYTPVCTTELGAFAKLEPEFTKRGVKLIGLSANTIDSHEGWLKDIQDVSGNHVKFPIIGDKERKVAYLYDMLDYQDTTNVDSKGIVSIHPQSRNDARERETDF